MAASNYITDKLQQALRAFLRAQDLGAIENVYKGIEHPTPEEEGAPPVTRKLPCVECVSQTAEAVDEQFLNWLADAEVRVRTNADDATEDEHHQLAANVFNKLTTDTLAADLTAALDDFTAFLVNFKTQRWELVERSWQSILTFQVHCAGSKIQEASVPAPTIGLTEDLPPKVGISCGLPLAIVFYRLDGGTWTQFGSPFDVDSGVLVESYATRNDYADSEISSLVVP